MHSASKSEIHDENAAVFRSAAKGVIGRGELATVAKSALRPSRTPGTQRKALGNISNFLSSADAQKAPQAHEARKSVPSPVKSTKDGKVSAAIKEHPPADPQEEEFDIVSFRILVLT